MIWDLYGHLSPKGPMLTCHASISLCSLAEKPGFLCKESRAAALPVPWSLRAVESRRKRWSWWEKHTRTHIQGDALDCQEWQAVKVTAIKKTLFKEPQLIITFIHLHLCGLLIVQFYPTGKPGDSLPVKRKPEKLIHLKKKVCNDVVWYLCFTLVTHVFILSMFQSAQLFQWH